MERLAGILLLLLSCMEAYSEDPKSPLGGRAYGYEVEAYTTDGNRKTVVVKITPVESSKQARQDYEDEDGPTTPLYIPQIIPGLTKIFNGIFTGNLNDIFHGSTSFAPKNVSLAIDSVYNTVVGLPPPATGPPARASTVAATLNGTAAAAATTTAATDDDDDEAEDRNEYFLPSNARFQPNNERNFYF